MRKYLKVIILLSVFVVGCATPQGTGPGQLATRAIEIRYIESNYEIAFKAATHSLFSLGYTISHTDKDSGILVGKRETKDNSAKAGWILLLGVAGAMMDTDTAQEITLFVDKGKNDKRTTLRIQMLVNGEAQIEPSVVDSIWIVAQREAMIINGVQVPKDLAEKYNNLKPTNKKSPSSDKDGN
jgi:hypothetical protein|tara:strand:- start:592 stop:1140 length:549 start_codon:yes stop_codon:yes gene_type:complete